MIAVVVALLVMVAAGTPMALRHGRWSPSLSFLYGSGVVFVAMLLLTALHVSWSLIPILIVVAVLSVAMFFATPARSVFPPVEHTRISIAIDVATMLFVGLYLLFVTAGVPWQWDFWAIWGFKGRVFFEFKGVDLRFLQSEWNAFMHPAYPLLTPLNFAFPAVIAERWDDRWLTLPAVAFVAAFAGVLRRITAREVSAETSAGIALCGAGIAAMLETGLAEIPLIVFGTLGLAFIRMALRGDDACWLPGAVLLGLAANTKSEGVTLLAAVGLSLVLCGRWRSGLRLWPAAVIAAPWIVFGWFAGLGNGLTASPLESFVRNLSDWREVLSLLASMTAKPLCWLLVAVAVPFVFRREKFILLVVAMQLAVFITAYAISPWGATWHIANSWDRLSRQLLAPASYAVLIALAAQVAARRNEDAEARSDLR